MTQVVTELDRFELHAAARIWETLTPEERSQLAAACYDKYGLSYTLTGGSKGDDGDWRNRTPDHTQRLFDFGLVTKFFPWAGLSSGPAQIGPTPTGTLVHRYGEAKRLVDLANSFKPEP